MTGHVRCFSSANGGVFFWAFVVPVLCQGVVLHPRLLPRKERVEKSNLRECSVKASCGAEK